MIGRLLSHLPFHGNPRYHVAPAPPLPVFLKSLRSMTTYDEQRIHDLPALIINEEDPEKAKRLSHELLRLLEEAERIKAREASRLKISFRASRKSP